MTRYEKRFLIAAPVILAILFSVAQLYLHAELNEKGHGDALATIGVPLDDVYIHCRYAENLLAGNGYCFNPGQMVTADTSPLWVVLLAIGGLVTSHLEVVAVIFSAIFFCVTVFYTYRLSNILGFHEYWARAVAALTFISGRLIWSALSGMEVTLACAIVVCVFCAYFNGRLKLTALLLGLGIATRPELWLLAAIIGIDQLVRLVKKETRVVDIAVSAGIVAALVIPVLLLPLIERGSFVFHSSVVQGAQFSFVPNWSYLWFAAKILGTAVMPPFIFGLAGLFYLRRDIRFRLMGAFAFGLPILLAFVAPQFRHHGRYFFPVIPIVIVMGIAMIGVLVERWQRGDTPKRSRIKYCIGFYVFFIAGAFLFYRWYQIYRGAIMNITEQHVVAAKWITDNTSDSDVIASQDVGAVGYLAKRPVIDLVGLVTPAVFPLLHDQRLVWDYARRNGANVFIIYNRLNPRFYEYVKDSLELRASLRVDPLVSSADTVLSIYRLKQHAAQ